MATLKELLESLQEPIPASVISKKKVGGATIDFVSWFCYCDLLDARLGLGNWQWEVTQQIQIGERYHCVGRLTIFGTDRTLSQDATGTEEIDCSSYGDPSSNAESMALRRCCAKFGLGRELWRKDKKSNSQSPSASAMGVNVPRRQGEISREEWLAKRNGNQFKLRQQGDYDPSLGGDAYLGG